MPVVESYPYLTLAQTLVLAEEWFIGEAGHERAMPSLLKDWDPLTDLAFSRTLTFDFPGIFLDCGLTTGAEVSIEASWHSPGTTLKERAAFFLAHYGAPRQSVNFSFKVSGRKLAGRLDLLTRVLLRKTGTSDSPMAATQPGSILWQDEFSLSIEGLGARFPMEFADFSELGYPPNAGWLLYWKKDFHAQVMGSVCLLINRQHERLRGIASGAVRDLQSGAILETIHFAVARELIVGGVENDEFIEETYGFPKGSVGDAVRLLIRRIFGDEHPEALRQMYRNEPDRFDCQLQHGLRLFHPQVR